MGTLLELHTWKFTNTEINLQTLPYGLSASSALLAKYICQTGFLNVALLILLLAAAHAFLAQNLAFHCYLLYIWSVSSGFIYEFLSENPCISFGFNILKFSNSEFFQSSAAWLMANITTLRSHH